MDYFPTRTLQMGRLAYHSHITKVVQGVSISVYIYIHIFIYRPTWITVPFSALSPLTAPVERGDRDLQKANLQPRLQREQAPEAWETESPLGQRNVNIWRRDPGFL